MTLDEIREMIQVVTETGIAELEVQRGEDRVRIRRHIETRAAEVVFAAPPVAAHPSSAAPVAPPQPATFVPEPGAGSESDTADEAMLDPSLTLVKAPIVGTFYEAAAPGAAPFVQIGDMVQPGKVLCIIESMKLMNEIEAEVAGTIVSKLASNGQAVEYGEALFAIKPV
jgi:acetyl-CoA carboxylase biotin carboxyl carrier protein